MNEPMAVAYTVSLPSAKDNRNSMRYILYIHKIISSHKRRRNRGDLLRGRQETSRQGKLETLALDDSLSPLWPSPSLNHPSNRKYK